MKFSIKKTFNQAKSDLANSLVLAKLMTFWALFTAVVLGFYGLRPMVILTIEKINLINEMQKVNADLDRNYQTLSSLRKEINQAKDSFVYLEKYMPNKADVSEYYSELSLIALGSGFSIKSFTPASDQNTNNIITVGLLLEGSGDVRNLVYNLEGLKRITKINNIDLRYSENKDINQVRMEIEIYQLGGTEKND